MNFPASEVLSLTNGLKMVMWLRRPALNSMSCIIRGIRPAIWIFIQQEDKVAMVGDVLFRGSIGRTDFTAGQLSGID